MTKDTTASGSPAATSSNKPEPSCFEILNVLRSRLILSRTKLVENVVLATLSENVEEIAWVEFSPEFHSHLVKASLSLFPEGLAPPALSIAKRALFVYILEVLNQEEDDIFRCLQSGKTKDNRALREKNRLARKRKRAAKREREREAAKRIVPPPGAPSVTTTDKGKKCAGCGRLFNSRKRYSKHACVTKKESVSPGVSQQQKEDKTVDAPPRSSSPTSDSFSDDIPVIKINDEATAKMIGVTFSNTSSDSTVGPPVTGTSGASSRTSDGPPDVSAQLEAVEGDLGMYLRWFKDQQGERWMQKPAKEECEDCDLRATAVCVRAWDEYGLSLGKYFLKCPCHADNARKRCVDMLDFPSWLTDALESM